MVTTGGGTGNYPPKVWQCISIKISLCIIKRGYGQAAAILFTLFLAVISFLVASFFRSREVEVAEDTQEIFHWKKCDTAVCSPIMLSPFDISFVYSMKQREQITFTGLKFPSEFHLENFSQAVEASNFYVGFKNKVSLQPCRQCFCSSLFLPDGSLCSGAQYRKGL